MHLTLSGVDQVVVLLSLLAVAIAGWMGARRGSTSETDYIVAGRRLTLPLFICTLIATWYGAILGVGEFVHRYGLVTILCFGVPYYLAAILYAVLLTGKIRRSRALSIPEQFQVSYGGRAAMISSVIMLIITTPAAYILMVATFVASITGWSFPISLIASAIVSTIYVVKGGLKSDVYANVVQVVVMYAGFAVLLAFSMSVFGSVDTMIATIPADHRSVPGPATWMLIVGWWIVSLQTFIDPNFHVRVAAAASPRTARNGMLWSVLGWIVFDLLTLGTGLYAVAYVHVADPVDTYIGLAEVVLPVAWKGLFAAGVIAAVMSTLDGYALVSATIIGRSVLDPLRRTPSVHSIRQGLVLTMVVGCLAAWTMRSVVDLLFASASLAVPPLLLPLLVSYTSHAGRIRRSIVPLMLLPLAASLSCLLLTLLPSVGSHLPEGLPMLAGLGTSICVTAVAVLKDPRS